MIRRLVLKNWRNYEDIDLEFGPGTTFIVAPNGIGKTSLMEAAAWAIFGDSGRRPDNAVRMGASSAVATAEVELTDHRILSITRTLPRRTGANASRPTVRLEGGEIDAARAADEIRHSYAADPTFLVRLTMPRGQTEIGGPSDFGLHEHLCRFFGVDGLMRAVENLDQRIKVQEKQIRAAKQGSHASAEVLAALRHHVTAAEVASAEATAAHERASARLNSAREAELYLVQLKVWQEKESSYLHALTNLTSTAASDVALDPQHPDTVQTALDAAANAVQEDLETLRVKQAQLGGRSAAIGQHSEELKSAHGNCPVCRRPLDAETVRSARSAHENELAQIQAEVERLHQREIELAGKQGRIRDLIQAFRDLPHPGPRPAESVATDADQKVSLGELEAELRSSLDRVIDRRATLTTAQAKVDASLADEAAHTHLQQLYAEEAVLRASRAAISTATSQLLDETIQPLAREVDARWAQVFPRRGQLRTSSTGAVCRDRGDESLPYSAFSTGERTGLVILLRLLVLETATKANFCWFDEPLEHLDPDARRQVAGILARASSAGPLRQIVVSTYEEPLARRLQERDPEHVSLVYVRPSPD
jgi:DNA repair exonuclease SbcCD ATPase subunit